MSKKGHVQTSLTKRLRLWEFPTAVQHLGARTVEPNHVIPPAHSRQTVRYFAIAAAELNNE